MDDSVLKYYALLEPTEREAALRAAAKASGVRPALVEASLQSDWTWVGRPKQHPPPLPWTYWFVRAGRGFGKTISAAQWVKSRALAYDGPVDEEGIGCRVALIAPTLQDVRHTMVEGEALALDTLVPTPTGYTTMGDLQEDDIVLDGNGAPCRVVHAHPVLLNRPCYRVRLKGGTEIIADGSHRWLTEDYECRAYSRRHSSTARHPEVVTTDEMRASLRHCSGRTSQANHGIRTSAFWAHDVELPIDPYVLGAWLGDGLSKAGAICDAEGDVISEVARVGYRTRLQPSSGTVPVYGVLGLQKQLRSAGLLRNKHVPTVYLRASISQRIALVQGLMDTDGHVSARGQCEFVSARRELADALVDLLCGLGEKAGVPRPKRTRNGTTHWIVKFTTTLCVFRMPRKRELLPSSYRDSDYWHVAEVEPVDSVPVRCITVDAPERTYLVTRHFVRTHNTGLLSILPASLLRGGSRSRGWNRGTCELYLANGTYLQGFSSEAANRLRGPQHHYAWGEEVSSWLDAKLGNVVDSTFSNLTLGLRLGDYPQAVLTSTPKANKLTRDILDIPAPDLALVIGSSYENRDNLPDVWWNTVVAPLEGTRTGRQEILAELLDDVEGALWTLALIEALRASKPPPLHRIVVAVDPNASSTEGSNSAGIVVAGHDGRPGIERHGYVLDDRTVIRASPRAWGQAAVDAYYDFEADRIVAEKNNGGEMVAHTIRTIDPNVPVKLVSASRGKRTRAEPVAALYEGSDSILGRVHHVGSFPYLEEEMTTWTPEAESPDRMDALVWALSELMVTGGGARIVSAASPAAARIPGVTERASVVDYASR